MTGPVLAFDINGARGAKLTRIKPVQVPADQAIDGTTHEPVVTPVPESVTEAEAVSPVVTPVPETDAPAFAKQTFSDDTQNRAELTALFAGLLGVDLQKSDILESLSGSLEGILTAQDIANALSGAGMVAKVTTVSPPPKSIWPALIETTSGDLGLVLAEEDDTLIIYDADRAGKRREVAKADVLAEMTGTLIHADIKVDELNRRHANAGKKDHWFWGEIKKFKRIMFEVALGSFVANLLAVAVALFSLQVYDRVIPHQSTAPFGCLRLVRASPCCSKHSCASRVRV